MARGTLGQNGKYKDFKTNSSVSNKEGEEILVNQTKL
jgi:hypothetical protein